MTVTIESPVPGQILGDRYQIRGLLGSGGMGEVLHAFDLKLRVDVALKSVRADRAVDARLRDRLRQEVRSARQVVSPNVRRIFDLIVEDGEEYVSMEYVEGETLAEAMRAGDRLRSTRRGRSAPSSSRVSMRSTRPVSCTAISSPRT